MMEKMEAKPCRYKYSDRAFFIMTARQTKERFVERSKEIFGDSYDYTEVIYSNNHTPVTITCKEHGIFNVSPKRHISLSQGCPVCGPTNHKKAMREKRGLGTNTFIERAKIIHDNKYDYSKTEYVSGTVKVTITCPIHGDFQQKPENHMNNKAGCLKCYHDSRRGKGGGGYTLGYFEANPDKIEAPAYLYVTRMTHLNDDFIKVGITTKEGVKGRFYYKANHGTKFDPILELKGTLKDLLDKEQALIERLQPYRYFPNRKFAGYTECFKLKQGVIDIVNQHLGVNISYTLET